MNNGYGLLGNYNAGQCAIIVHCPGTVYYYIFTLDWFGGSNGLRYSLVDMSTAGGLGSVVTKNVRLQQRTCEKIDAIYNPMSNSYWVITHPYESCCFYVYKVDDSGIITAPVISQCGIYCSGGIPYGYNAAGQMTVSPQGTYLAWGVYHLHCCHPGEPETHRACHLQQPDQLQGRFFATGTG